MESFWNATMLRRKSLHCSVFHELRLPGAFDFETLPEASQPVAGGWAQRHHRVRVRGGAGTPAGVQELIWYRVPVVSSLALLNHRRLAVKPPASIPDAHRHWSLRSS